MIVRELVALLGVKTDTESFEKAESGLDKIASAALAVMAALAAFKGLDLFRGLINNTAMIADSFDKMAARTGELTGDLQKLSFISQLTGTDVLTMQDSIKTLQKSVDETIKGSETFIKDFKLLDLEIKNADGSAKSFGELLPSIADGMNKLSSDTERSAVAQRLFGDAGFKMLPMLKSGADGIKAMMQEAEALGGVMSENLIKSSTEYLDNLAKMDLGIQGLKNSIVEAFLPSILAMQESTIEWFKANREWMSDHLEVVFKRIGETVKNLSEVLSGAVDLVVEWGKGLTPLEGKILKIGLAIAGIAALMMLPGGAIILLIGLVILLIEDFVVWKNGGKSLIGSLIGDFEKYRGTLEGIRDTLGLVKDVFVLMVEDMAEDFAQFVLDVQAAYEGPLVQSVIKYHETMLKYWGEWIDDLVNLWSDLVDPIDKTLIKMYDIMAEGMNKWLDSMLVSIDTWALNAAKKILGPFETVSKFFGSLFDSEGAKQVNVIAKNMSPQTAGPRAGSVGGAPGGQAPNINNQVSVEVNASGQLDEYLVANMVSEGVSNALERQNREAIRSLRPLAVQ